MTTLSLTEGWITTSAILQVGGSKNIVKIYKINAHFNHQQVFLWRQCQPQTLVFNFFKCTITVGFLFQWEEKCSQMYLNEAKSKSCNLPAVLNYSEAEYLSQTHMLWQKGKAAALGKLKIFR